VQDHPIRILFDECVGKPVLDAIRPVLRLRTETFEMEHVLNFQEQGVADEDWLPKYAGEGWIIITADRGMGGLSKGEKLTIVCRKLAMTHITLSSKVHHKNNFDKTVAILSVWNDIINRVIHAEGGTRFSLRLTTSDSATLKEFER